MNKFLLYKIKIVVLSSAFACCLVFSMVVAAFKFSYPIGFGAEIKAAASEYNIDENLVRAIIKVESGYNYKAVSKKGAVGLMQLMPSTASWVAGCLGEELGEDSLFNPAKNIRYGCYYLRYLFDKFGSTDLVLFAYNAGEGTLLSILNTNEAIDLYNIDIPETNKYIKKVTKAQKVYNKLYIKSDIKI